MQWIEMNLFPIAGEPDSENEIILNKMRPFVRKLLNDKCIETFHFLIEPEIRFRLYGDPAKFKTQAERWMKGLKDAGLIENKSAFNDAYQGEDCTAGRMGQDAYYVYMTAGSEIAFTMRGRTFEMPANFYHCRGFHFILNSCGFNITDEIEFYVKEVAKERIETYAQFFPAYFRKDKNHILQIIEELHAIVSKL